MLKTHLQENLNTPRFLEEYGQLLTAIINIIGRDTPALEKYVNLLHKYDKEILNLQLYPDIPILISGFARERFEAKQAKDYAKADEIRNYLETQGWQVDDYKWGYGLWRTRETEA